MKVALVCIAKNEDNYIDEWINYHLKLGFDKIIVYTNNWNWNTDNDKVSVIQFPGQVKQLQAYNHFIKNAIGVYDYAAIFDVDEFLVLKKHKTVKEFINDYPNARSIAINWVFFGDNDQQEIVDENYSLLQRFTKRQIGVNRHIKVITKINNNVHIPSPHHSSEQWTSPEGLKGNRAFNDNGSDEIAQLNHYFCKTKKEFEEKIQRGRSDVAQKRNLNEFNVCNFNDIEDLTALTFYNS